MKKWLLSEEARDESWTNFAFVALLDGLLYYSGPSADSVILGKLSTVSQGRFLLGSVNNSGGKEQSTKTTAYIAQCS